MADPAMAFTIIGNIAARTNRPLIRFRRPPRVVRSAGSGRLPRVCRRGSGTRRPRRIDRRPTQPAAGVVRCGSSDRRDLRGAVFRLDETRHAGCYRRGRPLFQAACHGSGAGTAVVRACGCGTPESSLCGACKSDIHYVFDHAAPHHAEFLCIVARAGLRRLSMRPLRTRRMRQCGFSGRDRCCCDKAA